MADASNILLGALIGAGGIGAALYMTGAFEKDEEFLLPPPRRLPPSSPIIAAPLQAAKPVGTPSPAGDREAIKAEVRAAMEAEAKVKAKATAKAAEVKRLTGRGWSRSTHKDIRKVHKKKGLPPPPADWDEEAYLKKNRDVRKAVNIGAMPSGYWHYMKYGKKEERALKGWRRPGYLAGIFANWDWRFD